MDKLCVSKAFDPSIIIRFFFLSSNIFFGIKFLGKLLTNWSQSFCYFIFEFIVQIDDILKIKGESFII